MTDLEEGSNPSLPPHNLSTAQVFLLTWFQLTVFFLPEQGTKQVSCKLFNPKKETECSTRKLMLGRGI